MIERLRSNVALDRFIWLPSK